MSRSILEVQNLSTYFETPAGQVRAVAQVSFVIQAGECLGIVGESGSGKSVTCRSVMGLIQPPGRVQADAIRFGERDLLHASAQALEELRGAAISMIFQDPLTSLNPVFTIGRQMTDVIRRHLRCSRTAARQRALTMLNQVGVSAPQTRLQQFPFQLSGGLRQRVMIALALACEPQLLIADEPTTALDVSIQAQILDLLQGLKAQLNFALIFVSHDLGVIANLSDRVLIMYAGSVVETATTAKIFAAPAHPYTVGLLNSAPGLHSHRRQPLQPIEGTPPNLAQLPPGCPFAPRCQRRTSICDQAMPPLTPLGSDQWVACYHP